MPQPFNQPPHPSLGIKLRISNKLLNTRYPDPNYKQHLYCIKQTTCILRGDEDQDTVIASYANFLEMDYLKHGYKCVCVVEKVEDQEKDRYVIRFPKRNVDYRKFHRYEVEDLCPYIPIKDQRELKLGDIIRNVNKYEQVVQMKTKEQIEDRKRRNPRLKISSQNNVLAQMYGVDHVGDRKVGQFCKICFDSQNDEENQLVTVCACKGDFGTIHVFCLKEWIETKYKDKRIYYDYHRTNITKLRCEVCQHPLPGLIKTQSDIIQLMPWAKPKKPYIMFNVLHDNSENSNTIRHKVFSPRQYKPYYKIFFEKLFNDYPYKHKNDKFYAENENCVFRYQLKVNDDIEIEKVVQIVIGEEYFEFQNILLSENFKYKREPSMFSKLRKNFFN